MKTIKSLIIISLLAFSCATFAQNVIEGTVYEQVNGKKQPLPGVNVYWKIANVGTVTDEHGHYSIEIHPTYKCLVFSFVGYENDTVHHMATPQHYDHVMSSPLTLSEVEVAARQKAQYVSALEPHHVEHITGEALRRCACCSLAESFETNASVDVAYADAVTGAKQIELLGLSGLYTQMMTENMPNFRGLASAFGLGYVPGTWLHGISVSKGTSSVRNGYESISGQINVDFKEPQEDHAEKVFVNGFVNTMAMTELNFHTRVNVGERDGLLLLGHVGFNPMKMDGNGDGFMDDPVTKQYSAFLRYNHPNTGHFGCKLGVKALKEERMSGQLEGPYGIGINTERYEAFAKTGFIFDRPETSLGIQQQFTYHKLNSYFGHSDYDATQLSYYANLLFDSYIVNDHHKYSVGASYSYDRYNEDQNFLPVTQDAVPSQRVEQVPGVFAEYVFSDDHHWTAIAGFRADYNSFYDRLFYTPRLHVRFRGLDELAIRVSAGKGYRSPNVLAENSTMLASSRAILFLETPKMEEAWNFGVNLSKHFAVGEKELQLLVDAYRTDFVNQIVLDRDANAHQIRIYNLNGKSFSNCAQIQLDYELFKNFDVSAAFRYTDVKMTINDTLREKPFVNRYKGLLTLSYAPGTWQFDLVTQFNGDCRIPDLSGNATAVANGQNLERSPFYVIMNAQVTKKFGEHWQLYFGGENLTNYKQSHPLVAASEPFGPDFDAAMVWGPLSGIRGYLGFRFQIK